jgi:hypothetical protein
VDLGQREAPALWPAVVAPNAPDEVRGGQDRDLDRRWSGPTRWNLELTGLVDVALL